MSAPRDIDVSHLPTYDHGAKSSMWWGTLAFCAIEGTGFALAIGASLYLAFVNPHWPIAAPPPDLLWGSLMTLLLLASALPNLWLDAKARAESRPRVQLGLVVLSLVGVGVCLLRIPEFGALNVRWDENAYGSAVWLLLGLHTTHIVTDLGDTLVLAVLMFTRHGRGKRFSDVTDNCFYWNFVVLSWLPIYAMIYLAPRLSP